MTGKTRPTEVTEQASNGFAGGTTRDAVPAPVPVSPGLDFGSAWDYAPAPETVKVAIAPRYGLYINGKFVEPARPKGKKQAGAPERYFPTLNPATEEPLAEVAAGAASDVDAAVRAAREALPEWIALRAEERAKLL